MTHPDPLTPRDVADNGQGAGRRRSFVADPDLGHRPLRKALWFHALCLAVTLCALQPIVGFHGFFVNDEGAALAQVELLSVHETWFMANPFPSADPEGRSYPFDRAIQTDHGFAPLLKQPLYPLVLTIGERVGGRWGIALLGVLATTCAAVGAGSIGRALRPGIERWCLWVTGLSSPLFFDSFVLQAHVFGAAGVGLAGIGVIRFLGSGRPTWLLTTAAALVWSSALRQEGVLLSGAMGLTLLAMAVAEHRSGRECQRRYLGAGSLVGLAGVVGFAGNRLAVRILAPRVYPSTLRIEPSFGFVDGRINAFVTTWITPGYGSGSAAMLPIITSICAVVVGVQFRRREQDPNIWMLLAACSAVGTAIWVGVAARTVVPGLFPAFPLLIAGVAAWPRTLFQERNVRMHSSTVMLFVLAVLATTYAVGGGAEWGSRYVAIGLPLAVPLLVLALETRFRTLPARAQHHAAIALIVLTFTPTVATLTALRSTHTTTATRIEALATAMAATVPGDGGKPVVVTDLLPLGRLMWAHLDEVRFLAPDTTQLPGVLERLHELGIEEFTFVAGDEHPRVGSAFMTDGCTPIGETDPWYACLVTAR